MIIASSITTENTQSGQWQSVSKTNQWSDKKKKIIFTPVTMHDIMLLLQLAVQVGSFKSPWPLICCAAVTMTPTSSGMFCTNV